MELKSCALAKRESNKSITNNNKNKGKKNNNKMK